MAPERMKAGLSQQLCQEQRLTPQLIQSMEVLQMSSQELLAYIDRAVNENPLLEREESTALQDEYRRLRGYASWLDAFGGAVRGTRRTEQGSPDWEMESLSAFLCDQLERMALDKRLLPLCRYMARLVDENGYLAREDLDSVRELEVPHTMIDQALAVLQSLEPAGVAAGDLAQCLTLQLQRRGEKDAVVLAVVEGYLDQLGRGHYGAIARALHISEREVRAAAQKIGGLNPHPGRAFRAAEETVYLRPDVFVLETEGKWQVVLNEYYLPRVTVSSYYAEVIRRSDDRKTTAYLRDKMRQACWLLQSLEQRGVTLQRCAQTLLRQQMPFFTGQTAELSPMTLRQLAEELSLHPSTVTRALRGKYLQCRQGTYPMRYFFPLPAGGASRQAVQQKLLQLIRGEDPARPFSDERLCWLLAEQKIEVARRTVAKYRAELGIPPAARRKK